VFVRRAYPPAHVVGVADASERDDQDVRDAFGIDGTALGAAGIDPGVRPETLDPARLLALARCLKAKA
jgi:hypothetical protein